MLGCGSFLVGGPSLAVRLYAHVTARPLLDPTAGAHHVLCPARNPMLSLVDSIGIGMPYALRDIEPPIRQVF